MKTQLILLSSVLLGLGAACVDPPEAGEKPLTNTAGDWRDEVIYQVMTDRFSDGDPSNNFNVNLADAAAYHGGDWRGIIDRLDYLQDLGVTAIWISPVVRNVESDAGFSSYHGYWTQDFTRPNPHFGDVSALRELSDAAHARGMKVILDIVTNHVGQAFYYDINKNGQPDEFYIGQGGGIVPLGQGGDSSDLVRVSEWDPDFSATGVESWTSLGPSGLAPVVFVNEPETNRVAPFPEIFSIPQAYNRKGRVTVWDTPSVCGCESYGCAWDDPCRRQQELLGDFPGGLKDLDTRRQPVRDALFEIFARWIEVGDFDGFRIDTLKHVEKAFWDDFCPRIRAFAKSKGKDNFLMFGEAFDGDDNLLGDYTQGNGVDGVFNFSQYYSVFRGAILGPGGRTCEIARAHCRRVGCNADPCGSGAAVVSPYNGVGKENGPTAEDGTLLNSQQLMVNFSENHDVGRLLYFMPESWSEEEKRKVHHLALTYLMTTEGIPSLYYGVEQAFSGGNDPANRETLWADRHYQREVLVDGRFRQAQRTYDSDGDGRDDTAWRPYDRGNPTFQHIKSLIEIRKAHQAIRQGSTAIRWSTEGFGGEDEGIYAFERQLPSGAVLVVMNLSERVLSQTRSMGSTMRVSFPPGTVLVDTLDAKNTWVVTSTGCSPSSGEGCVDVSVAPKTAQILVPNLP